MISFSGEFLTFSKRLQKAFAFCSKSFRVFWNSRSVFLYVLSLLKRILQINFRQRFYPYSRFISQRYSFAILAYTTFFLVFSFLIQETSVERRAPNSPEKNVKNISSTFQQNISYLNYQKCSHSGGFMSFSDKCQFHLPTISKICGSIGCRDIGDLKNTKISETVCSKYNDVEFGYSEISKTQCLAIFGCYTELHQCRLPRAGGFLRSRSVLFTFIITCFWYHSDMEATLKSIFQQSYRNWELIVVDDGTPGRKCSRKVNQIKKKYFNENRNLMKDMMRVVYKNKTGPSDTKNFAKYFSSGDYVCFIDAGDLIFPNFLLRATQAIHLKKSANIIYGNQIIFGENDHGYLQIMYPRYGKEYEQKFSSFPVLPLIRKTILNEISGFETSMTSGTEDYDLWVQVFRKLKKDNLLDSIVFLEEPQSIYMWKKRQEHVEEGQYHLSKTLVQLRHANIYKNICKNLAQLYCEPEHTNLSKLEELVWNKKNTCLSTIWLVLKKSKQDCLKEARLLLFESVKKCRVNNQDEDMKQVLLYVFGMVIKNVLPFPKQNEQGTCLSIFETTCKEHKQNAFPYNFKTKKSYRPYYSHHNEDIVSTVPELRNLLDKFIPSITPKNRRNQKIPNIFHFVFGFSGPSPYFKFYHYLSVQSAISHNNPDAVMIHYQYRPTGPWWRKIQNKVVLEKWNTKSVNIPRCLSSYAHISDYIRLLVLKKYGGVYMDLDIVSLRTLNISYDSEFAAAWQDSSLSGTSREGSTHYGLCNALMMSVKNSTFVNILLSTYKFFRSCGHDLNWDEHSVRLPARILEYIPSLKENNFVLPLPSEKYWAILWTQTEQFFIERGNCDDKCYLNYYKDSEVFHLWSNSGNKSYEYLLNNLSYDIAPNIGQSLLRTIVTRAFSDSEKRNLGF